MRYRVSVFIVSCIPFVTRHTGVCAQAVHNLWGSQRIMGHQDGSRLPEPARDKVLLAVCVSLEFVEFRECFVVVN